MKLDADIQKELDRFINTDEFNLIGVIVENTVSKNLVTITKNNNYWPDSTTAQCIKGRKKNG